MNVSKFLLQLIVGIISILNFKLNIVIIYDNTEISFDNDDPTIVYKSKICSFAR